MLVSTHSMVKGNNVKKPTYLDSEKKNSRIHQSTLQPRGSRCPTTQYTWYIKAVIYLDRMEPELSNRFYFGLDYLGRGKISPN